MKAHPTTCEHCGKELDMEWDNEKHCHYCVFCYGAVAVQCPLCGGEGYMSEADMEGDWINFTDDEIVTCRECDGYGWTADPSFQ